MRAPFAALALALTLSACATAAPEPISAQAEAPVGRDCFRNDDINGFSVVDDDNIKVSVGPRRDYILTGNRIGRDLRFSQSVAVIARSGWICTGNGLDVQIAGGDIPLRAFVRNVARAPEEQAAESAAADAPAQPPQ